MTRPGRTRRAGMTLLELVLAIGIMVLLIAFMFGFYWNALRSRERGLHDMESTQLARVIAQQIAREIRGASGTMGSYGAGLSGGEHDIRLTTVVLPDREMFRRESIVTKQMPAQSDVRQIQYYLAYDPETEVDYPDGRSAGKNLGLVRREIKTLNQAAVNENRREEVDTDLLAPELGYLRFRYFDGVDWIRKWDIAGLPGQNALPQAVEVTVGYQPLPPPENTNALGSDSGDSSEDDTEDVSDIADPRSFAPDEFTLVVRIPQSDTFFGSRIMRATKKFSTSGGTLSGGLGGLGSDSGKSGSGG